MKRTITDTADRLRPLDLLTHDGKRYLVADITEANIIHRPGALAVLIVDPHGGDTRPRLLFVNPGYILEFERAPRSSTRPYAAEERIKVRKLGLGYEVFDTITGDWVYIVPTGSSLPWDSYSEAHESALAYLADQTALTSDPEVGRVVTALRNTIYQRTAEHVLDASVATIDKAIELGLIRVVKVQRTTYNRQGERMLAVAA